MIKKSTKQTSKQNITRDTKINNKQTVTRGKMGGENGGGKDEGFSGTTIKHTRKKPRRGGIRGGSWGWLGSGEGRGGR